MMQGLTFVEKEFYAQPPKKNASLNEWKKWLNLDNSFRRRAARKFYSKPVKMKNLPEFDRAFNMVKVDGSWRQRPSMSPLLETQEAERLRQMANKIN